MVSSFSLCNGMCKSKCIRCVVFLFPESHEDLHTAFSVLYRPAHLCEIHLSAPLPSREHPSTLVSSLSYWSSLNQAQTHQLGCFIMEEKKKKKACDLAILPQFYKQVLASPTKNKRKKNLGGKNPIFKKPSIFPQPKPMCVWCCILLKSDLGKQALLTNRDVLPSPRLVHFVSVEIKSIYWGYTQQCFPLCFVCKSGELPSLRLQIINIPYWILDDFDMADLSNLDIVFHPFMTAA